MMCRLRAFNAYFSHTAGKSLPARMIVSDVAGTTRDSVDVRFTRGGRDYVFVDTAGVRRRTKISDSLEKYSVNSAIKSSTKADVTLLTLDAAEGVSQQDKRLMVARISEQFWPSLNLRLPQVEPPKTSKPMD